MNSIKIICNTILNPTSMPGSGSSGYDWIIKVIEYVLGIIGLALIIFGIYGVIAGIFGLLGKKGEKKYIYLLIAGVLSFVVGLPIVFVLYAIVVTIKNNILY